MPKSIKGIGRQVNKKGRPSGSHIIVPGRNYTDAINFASSSVVAATGVLDIVDGAAYALHYLGGGYSGPVVNVRRDSDDTVQDFTPSEILDGTLLTFTGAGSGFIATWYDQGSQGLDIVQATLANQPRIVDTGTVEVRGGFPAVRFVRASAHELGLGTSVATVDAQALLFAYEAIDTTSSWPTSCSETTGSGIDRHFILSTSFTYRERKAAALTTYMTVAGDTNRNLHVLNMDNGGTGNGTWNLNGVEVTTTATLDTTAGNTGGNIDIGGEAGSDANGYVQAVIWTQALLTPADIVSVEAALNDYLGIY